MKHTKLTMAEVEHNLNGLQWGLIYYQDDIQLKKIADIDAAAINNPKLLEARLFGEGKEIHIFEYDGKLSAVLNEDDSQEQIDRKYKLAGRFKPKEKDIYLHVRDYISFDKDGMAYIEYSRLVKVE
jgi:hypothetical protein